MMLTRTAFRFGLLLVSLLWLTAIVAAPYAARAGGPASVAASGIYLAGSVICHQQARRSFHLDGVQLPVCARCAGIYAAAPFGVLFAWALFRRGDGGRRPRVPMRESDPRWRTVLIAAALPTAATVAIEWVSGTMIPGPVRAAAGAPIGFAVMWYLGTCLSRPVSDVHGPASGGPGVLG